MKIKNRIVELEARIVNLNAEYNASYKKGASDKKLYSFKGEINTADKQLSLLKEVYFRKIAKLNNVKNGTRQVSVQQITALNVIKRQMTKERQLIGFFEWLEKHTLVDLNRKYPKLFLR